MARPQKYDVAKIVELHKKKYTHIEIAEEIGCDRSTVSKILGNRDLLKYKQADIGRVRAKVLTAKVKEAEEQSVYSIQAATQEIYNTLSNMKQLLEQSIVRVTRDEDGNEIEEPDLAVINMLRQTIDSTARTIDMATHQMEIVYNANRVRERDEVLMRVLRNMGDEVVRRFQAEVNAIGATQLVLNSQRKKEFVDAD